MSVPLEIQIAYYGPHVWQWRVEWKGRTYLGHAGSFAYIIDDVKDKMRDQFPAD